MVDRARAVQFLALDRSFPRSVLHSLTADDCRLVYAAIRLAQPAGLGKVEDMDVSDEPPQDLLAAMAAAELS